MQPLADIDADRLRAIRGVMTDIDDTLTTHGSLTAEAYTAMQALQQAGLHVVPITGRPAGWCDHIARMWPVSAVVGENGAFYYRHDREHRRLVTRYLQSERERARGRARLDMLKARILAEVPGTGIASDQAFRVSDLAIDFCEDVTPLDQSSVDRIVAIAEEAGATVKVSSIHVNIWYGEFDKLSMTRRMLREVFDEDLDATRGEWCFIGDSPNDAPMFGYFPVSVGVANVADFGGRLAPPPAYVTRQRCGAGFVELANALLNQGD